MSLAALLARVNGRTRAQALGATFVLAVVCWFFGADVWHSILVATAVTTLAYVVTSVGALADTGQDGWGDDGRHASTGARNDVVVLSQSLRGRLGRVDPGAVQSVRQIARRRLTRHRLSLDAPSDRRRIEQLIGRRSCAMLVNDRSAPTLRSLVRCLDALDALENRPSTAEEAP